MEKSNIAYYVNFIRSTYQGSHENCNRYIEENLKPSVEMMDKYTKQHNQWWLENSANMAYHQLKEIDTVIVEYATFIDALSRLLNRPIQSFEISKNYSNLLNETNNAYTNLVREQVVEHYHIPQRKIEAEHQL